MIESKRDQRDTGSAEPLPPEALELRRHALFTGQEWQATYAVVKWPSEVGPAFLQSLLGKPGRVDLSFFFDPVPQDQAAKFLSKQLGRLHSAQATAKDAQTQWELQAAEAQADRVGMAVVSGAGRFFYASLYIRVCGDSEEEVLTAGKMIRQMCKSLLIDCRPMTYRPLEGYASMLPINRNALAMVHPFDSHSAAMGLYPFATGEILGHESGIMVGRTIRRGSQAMKGATPVFIDRWRLKNHHAVILAASGAGKSVTAKAWAIRSRIDGDRIRIVDPDGEYHRLVLALGGVIITDPNQPVPDNDLICWSMGDAEEGARQALMTGALLRIWEELDAAKKRGVFRRTQVIVDEAMMALRANPEATKLIWNLIKRSRRRLCGLTIITQDLKDVLGTDLGDSILSNATIKLLLAQDQSAINKLGEVFNLSEGEKSFLVNAPQGQGLLVVEQERGAIEVEVSDWEYRFCESTPVEAVDA